MRRILYLCVALMAERASAQAADTSHAILLQVPLYGPVVTNKIAAEMIKQNISLRSESLHSITGTPIDAPDVEVRINVAESGPDTMLMLTAVGVSGATSSAYPIDRATHMGRDWRRLEALAEALRKSLVIK
jgi:hypothetical protein